MRALPYGYKSGFFRDSREERCVLVERRTLVYDGPGKQFYLPPSRAVISLRPKANLSAEITGYVTPQPHCKPNSAIPPRGRPSSRNSNGCNHCAGSVVFLILVQSMWIAEHGRSFKSNNQRNWDVTPKSLVRLISRLFGSKPPHNQQLVDFGEKQLHSPLPWGSQMKLAVICSD
ncbi:hypothetical protein CDAR_459231 [Caerostris darwini]|uniref:Uncharacterized protein n=1 Tax=Caerostris darwini TaxID=1538125 RepID=A0AAV4PH50_9ARAC|nr:hypothetical protein CDAR_459231 [Caerostris darwini]